MLFRSCAARNYITENFGDELDVPLSCCCDTRTLPETQEEPPAQISTPNFKFIPSEFLIIATLDILPRNNTVALEAPCIHEHPPAISSRQILAMNSILII